MFSMFWVVLVFFKQIKDGMQEPFSQEIIWMICLLCSLVYFTSNIKCTRGSAWPSHFARCVLNLMDHCFSGIAVVFLCRFVGLILYFSAALFEDVLCGHCNNVSIRKHLFIIMLLIIIACCYLCLFLSVCVCVCVHLHYLSGRFCIIVWL